jgi:hypothetical protein
VGTNKAAFQPKTIAMETLSLFSAAEKLLVGVRRAHPSRLRWHSPGRCPAAFCFAQNSCLAALKKRQREREWQQIRLGPLNADLSLMVKVAPIRNRPKNAMSVSGYMHLAQQGPWRQKLAGSIKVKFRGLGEPPVTNLAVALWILINQKKLQK